MLWTVSLRFGGPSILSNTGVRIGDYIYCIGDDMESIFIQVLNTKTYEWKLMPHNDPHGLLCGRLTLEYRCQRYRRTIFARNGKIYMWGGRYSNCNALYCFDLKKTHRWTQLKVKGCIPPAYDLHSFCVDRDNNNNYIYIYGGLDVNYNYSNEVYCLNLKTMEWSHIKTFHKPPFFCIYHSAVIIYERMYVFGGRWFLSEPKFYVLYPEIIYLDLNTKIWNHLTTTGKRPAGREEHSMFTHNGLIYIYGGHDSTRKMHFNDLHAYNPQFNCWQLVKMRGNSPDLRFRPDCIMVESRMFVIGGVVGPNPQNGIICKNTNVLDFKPSLKTLAMLAVVKYCLDTKTLHESLRKEIRQMKKPNSTVYFSI